MMKIVTYNVNGLRQRISQFGSLRKLLDSFDADIICFQETKLRRQELKSDLVLAEGYESFFSCTRTSDKGRTGYSGVATFCRVNSAFSSNEVALPVAAEEGFTGVLDASGSKIVEGLEEFAKDELCKVDSEGRCIITDHGHFILFNIYGPRAGSDDVDRIQFKHKFFKILQKRWEFLLCQKRRIFVVGDLNIAPAAIDRCEAEPDFEENEFRRWFRLLLVESGGPFFDVFRAKHPERRDAYTCWPSNTGAEQFNYGTRIDHILCGGPCLHEKHDLEGHNFVTCHVKECDILVEYKRWKPGNTLGTRWKGGMNIKLEGSDHAPVYTSFGEVPVIPEHSTPSLASRYLPMIRGLQQTLVSVLMKREVAKETKSGEASSSLTTETTKMERFSESVERSFNNCHELGMPPSDHCSFANQEPKGKLWKTHENHRDLPKDAVCDSTITTGNCKHIHLIPGDRANKKARKNQFSQLSLKSFFQKSPNPRQDVDKLVTDTSLNPADVLESLHDTTPVADYNNCHPELHDVNFSPCSQDQEEQDGKCSLDTEKNNIALLEWKRIQQLMENTIPLCKGHREPCVARVVKKPGPTFGRRFYVCARAEQIVVTLNGLLQNPSTNNNVVSWFASESFILYLVGGILTLYLHRNMPIPPMFSDSNQALTWSRGWFGSFLVGLAVKLGY